MIGLKQSIERDVESGLYDGTLTIAAIGGFLTTRAYFRAHLSVTYCN